MFFHLLPSAPTQNSSDISVLIYHHLKIYVNKNCFANNIMKCVLFPMQAKARNNMVCRSWVNMFICEIEMMECGMELQISNYSRGQNSCNAFQIFFTFHSIASPSPLYNVVSIWRSYSLT